MYDTFFPPCTFFMYIVTTFFWYCLIVFIHLCMQIVAFFMLQMALTFCCNLLFFLGTQPGGGGSRGGRRKAIAKVPHKMNRSRVRLKKEEQARRDEHERWLDQQRHEADMAKALLLSTVSDVAGPSAAVSTPPFPEDSNEDITSSLTPPVRLSQEEKK